MGTQSVLSSEPLRDQEAEPPPLLPGTIEFWMSTNRLVKLPRR